MSIKAGRVGVNPSQVNPVDGSIISDVTSGYTKQEADAKFLTQTNAASTYESKNDASTAYNVLQPKTLSVPISMLVGSQLVPKTTVEAVVQTMNNAMTTQELTDAVTVKDGSSGITLATDVEYLNADNHFEACVGNIKYISAKVKGITANASTWATIGTLSGDLKPYSAKILSGFCQKNATSELLDCIIEENTLKVRRAGNAITATDLLNIMFVYI